MLNKIQLLNLKVKEFLGVTLTQEEILEFFSVLDAFWMHSGDPKDPHAELTSGLCSNGFFDCLRVLSYLNLSDILAYQMARKVRNVIGSQRIDWTIGSPMAGITFAHDVGRYLEATQNMCLEKDPADKKRMLWNRMKIPEGETVLQIEELITTAHTLNEVERAIREGNKDQVSFLPYVPVLVHRPPKLPMEYYGERKVIPLVEKEIWAVPQDQCPLCRAGSKRYKPKANWAALTGKN